MNDDWPRQPRAVEQIEKEFDGMLVHHWEQETAKERFEALWDEVNAAAMRTLDTDVGSAYIALLSRMQNAFDKRYSGSPLTKGNGLGGPVV